MGNSSAVLTSSRLPRVGTTWLGHGAKLDSQTNDLQDRRAELVLIGGLTLVTFVLHLVFYKGYGFFRDELYFIVCGNHLDWGYVDQPPGVPFIAWASRHILGDTLFAIRFVPMLFAAAQVMFTGLIVRVMGGGRYAILLASLAILAAPMYFGSYLNTDMVMLTGWAACSYVVVRIMAGGSPKLWLWFGLAAGLSLQGKHEMAFFGFALLVGLLLSPQRKMLLSPWLYAGGAVALVIILPNIIWEIRHNWATLELLQNIAHSRKNVVLGPVDYFKTNILFLSPLSFPIWFVGILWCLFAKAGRAFRAMGWMWIVAFTVFILLKGKAYYLAPVYPALFAAGSVVISQWLSKPGEWRRVLKPAYATLVILFGILLWPFAMPMMSVEKFIAYEQALHVTPTKTETMHLDQLPQQYADMFGWREMAAAVARAYETIPLSERGKCGVFGQDYGQAAAIDYFGRQNGLPHAISGHQNYWLWGPAPYTGECLIVLDDTRENLDKLFTSVVFAGETYQQYAIPYENHLPIWICRGSKFGKMEDLWPKVKKWI
jgi:hypothetical protein